MCACFYSIRLNYGAHFDLLVVPLSYLGIDEWLVPRWTRKFGGECRLHGLSQRLYDLFVPRSRPCFLKLFANHEIIPNRSWLSTQQILSTDARTRFCAWGGVRCLYHRHHPDSHALTHLYVVEMRLRLIMFMFLFVELASGFSHLLYLWLKWL